MRNEPATHVQILATLAVGSCYDPDERVPDRLSGAALEIAASVDDPDVLADALLARCVTFSGIAARAADLVPLLEQLAALPHAQREVDEVIVLNLGSQVSLCLGQVTTARRQVAAGIEACDRLRLPVNRAQLRWMEATLTMWSGLDLDLASRQVHRAFEIHRETELYQTGVYELSLAALAWDRAQLAELDIELTNPALDWLGVVLRAARRAPGWADGLRAEIARDEPTIWTTHARWTLLAHALADLDGPAATALDRVALAASLRHRLEPLQGMTANVGQIGIVGPIDLALSRLCRLQGDLAGALAYARSAADLCAREAAARHLLRAELLELQVRAELGERVAGEQLTTLAERAQGLDLPWVVTAARQLAAQADGI